jgi:hypothetical protein
VILSLRIGVSAVARSITRPWKIAQSQQIAGIRLEQRAPCARAPHNAALAAEAFIFRTALSRRGARLPRGDPGDDPLAPGRGACGSPARGWCSTSSRGSAARRLRFFFGAAALACACATSGASAFSCCASHNPSSDSLLTGSTTSRSKRTASRCAIQRRCCSPAPHRVPLTRAISLSLRPCSPDGEAPKTWLFSRALRPKQREMPPQNLFTEVRFRALSGSSVRDRLLLVLPPKRALEQGGFSTSTMQLRPRGQRQHGILLKIPASTEAVSP